MSPATPENYGTAVIVGASIGGSAVAAALSPHFEQIIVIERDRLPDGPSTRKGVPHSYQFHTLTVGGRLTMEEIFPGLTADVHAAGAPMPVLVQDAKYASKFGWFPRVPTDHLQLAVTRRYLEWYLRSRASALGNVRFVDHTLVTGLVEDEGKIVGVRTKRVSALEGEATVSADFVVDSSGRPSRAPQWLSELGYAEPEETVVNAHWGYATTYIEVPEEWQPDWHATYIGPTVSGDSKASTRGGAMWRQEGNRYVITAQGCGGDLPPADLDGFKDYLSSFGYTDFVDLIDQFGASEPIEAWRNTSNRLRDFAGSPSPENFVVVGDACAAFNPIYGQGMSLAAFAVKRLGEAIEQYKSAGEPLTTGFARQFQAAYQQFLEPFWEFSTGADYAIPGVEVNGVALGSDDRPDTQYADRLLALATEDSEIAVKFMETVSMLRDTSWMADDTLKTRILEDWDRLGSITRS